MNYILRHGVMRFLGEFEPEAPAAYLRNQSVIVQTERGLEVGEVLCEATPRAIDYLQEPTKGKIVRLMTDDDRVQHRQAQEREDAGHWEGDLVFGKPMSPVATLVERSTRFVMLVALPNGHKAALVADALAAKITTLPAALTRTLTWVKSMTAS